MLLHIPHCFFIHRKLRPMNEKALRAGCASRGAEVSCKQHRSSAKESQATLYYDNEKNCKETSANFKVS